MTHRQGCGRRVAGRRDHRGRRADVRRRRRHRVHGPAADREPAREGQRGQGRRPGGRRDHRHQAVGGQPGRHQGHDQRRLRSPAARDRRGHGAPGRRCPRWRTATSRCTPGPTTARRSRRAACSTTDETTNAVDLDQLFNTLDPKARKGLQGVCRDSAPGTSGQSDNLQETFKYLGPRSGISPA